MSGMRPLAEYRGLTMRGVNGGVEMTIEVIKLSSAAALIVAGLFSIIARTVGAL
jgi:hypothetical protein